MYNNKQIKDGIIDYNEQIINWIIKKYKPYSIAICLNYIKDRALCEDISHEILINVIFDKIRLYDENRSFKSWFAALATNYIIDQYRKIKARGNESQIERLTTKQVHKIIQINYLSDIQDKLDHNTDVLDCIYFALKIIKESNGFSIVEMRVINNMEYTSLAEMMNVTKSKAKTMYYKEKLQIKALTEKCLQKNKAAESYDSPPNEDNQTN